MKYLCFLIFCILIEKIQVNLQIRLSREGEKWQILHTIRVHYRYEYNYHPTSAQINHLSSVLVIICASALHFHCFCITAFQAISYRLPCGSKIHRARIKCTVPCTGADLWESDPWDWYRSVVWNFSKICFQIRPELRKLTNISMPIKFAEPDQRITPISMGLFQP